MTANLVTVNETFVDQNGNPGAGTWLFAATGTLMDASYVAIVAPVVSGSLDGNGKLQYTNSTTGVVTEGAVLLASDDFEAGALLWNFFGDFQGMSKIHVTDIVLNYANGANQNLFTILAAAGWVPGQP